MGKIRVLHLLSQLELTGAEVYAQQLIQFQKEQGHEPYIISDRIHVPLPIPLHSLPVSIKSRQVFKRNKLYLKKFLIEKKIDVIHCHSRAAVRLANSTRKSLQVAMISTIHGRQHSSLGKRFFDSYGEYKILICENLQYQFEHELKSQPGSLRVLRNPFATSIYLDQTTNNS
ncbi:MAG: glycosyltransferase [Bdellovibrionales bacterium]|nr:glycosyltransferase [Bdellovibrionales bacterium]